MIAGRMEYAIEEEEWIDGRIGPEGDQILQGFQEVMMWIIIMIINSIDLL